jgi:chromosome segregation ATPase
VQESTQLVDTLSTQVNDIVAKGNIAEMEAIHTILESAEMPELMSLCEQVEHAINGTSLIENEDQESQSDKDLREAYKTIADLRGQVKDLGEQIKAVNTSVTGEKVDTITLSNVTMVEALDHNFGEVATQLSEIKSFINKFTGDEVSTLKSQLESKSLEVSKLSLMVEQLKNRLGLVEESEKELELKLEQSSTLLAHRDAAIKEQSSTISELEESVKSSQLRRKELKLENGELQEQLRGITEDLTTLNESSNFKVSEYEELVENYNSVNDQLTTVEEERDHYKGLAEGISSQVESAESFIRPYVGIRCDQLGISTDAVFELLPESFTFEKVEGVLKKLADRKVKQSRIPVRLTESTETVVAKTKEPQNNKTSSLASLVASARNL